MVLNGARTDPDTIMQCPMSARRVALAAAGMSVIACGVCDAQSLPASAAPVGSGLGSMQRAATGASAPASSDAGTVQGPPRTSFVAPSVTVRMTSTDNTAFGTGRPARADTVLELVPRVAFASDHARWRLGGDFRVDAVHNVRGTEPDVLLPDGTLRFNADLVERFLHLDAGVQSQRNAITPWAGLPGPTVASAYTTTQFRVSPYLEHDFGHGLRASARSDETWTRVSDNPGVNGLFGGRRAVQTFGMTQYPLPWGYALTAQDDATTFDGLPDASLRDTTVRAAVMRKASENLRVGVIGGAERVRALLSRKDAGIYGVSARWSANPATFVDARIEERFFGTGWALQAQAGSAQMRLNIDWTREPSTFLAGLAGNGLPGAAVGTLLDSLLQSRVPDPVARAQAVQTLLGETGLPAGLPGGVNFYTTAATLRNQLRVRALILRARNSYALTLFRSRTEDLFLPGQGVVQAVQLASADNVESGVAFAFGRKLDARNRLSVNLLHVLETGFGPNAGRSSRQSGVIVELDHDVTPRTLMLIGARRQLLFSSTLAHTAESALFVGLIHHF